MKHDQSEEFSSDVMQYSTFTIAGRIYGIDVKKVQEIVKQMPMTKVPLSPPFVVGLVNLRGQVATAIKLGTLFETESTMQDKSMNVVCKYGDDLISFIVDDIGDVIEVSQKQFEPTPKTIAANIRELMHGVYKTEHALLSIIDVDKVINKLVA